DVEVPPLDRGTRAMLEVVLATESLLEKLVGMQLFVESIALSVFKTVRELNVEPVLSDLLLYYERDEARHVGLGIQHTPDLIRNIRWRDRASLDLFQLRILMAALFSLKSMESSFRSLGVDPRAIADYAKQKAMVAMELLAEANGRPVDAVAGPAVSRIF